MIPNRNKSTADLSLTIKALVSRINDRRSQISNKELIELCRTSTNSFFEADDPHIFHELAETSLNLLLKTHYAKDLLTSNDPVKNVSEIIKPIAQILPTQTWRSPQQIKFQQFSTPPSIAYLLAYFLNLKPQETILEPSAGTGNLAIWASIAGSIVLTNEIDERRRELLEYLCFEPTTYNAEFIHDFLPPEIIPDVVMMNPPFSANGGRTKNSSKYGFRHVESALESLKRGGRFGIILGEAGGLNTKTGREFWQKTLERFKVRANIKLSGREYYKLGTTVDINLIFGEKLMKPHQVDRTTAVNQIPFFIAQTVEEAFDKIAIQNLRFK